MGIASPAHSDQRVLKRILFGIGLLLFACANWPVIVLFNRPGPFIFGLPPFLAAMIAVNIAATIFLAVCYWLLD